MKVTQGSILLTIVVILLLKFNLAEVNEEYRLSHITCKIIYDTGDRFLFVNNGKNINNHLINSSRTKKNYIELSCMSAL